ncbi:unnamed protein product, partial [Lymnaea stagnalis]
MFVNQTACGVVSLLGMAANVINIIVFYQQGFKDTVNISLTGLAISDLMSLVTSLWVSICWNPLMYYTDLPFIPKDVEYLTGSMPHLLFTRVSGWITAFVAFERCLCIALPLKVKAIITPRLVAWFMVSIFLVVGAAQTPLFCTSTLEWVFSPGRNRTVIGQVARAMSEEIDGIAFSVNLIFPFGSFSIVVVCTAVSSAQLKQTSQWRAKSAVGPSRELGQSVSGREKKVVKMVVMISVLFIVSFLPTAVAQIVYGAIADEPPLVPVFVFYIGVAFSFIKVLEAVHASVGIILYYTMSSKYR